MSQGSINGPPKLRELTAFPTRDGKVNVIQQIGVKYLPLGAQLLDDPTGVVVNSHDGVQTSRGSPENQHRDPPEVDKGTREKTS